MTTEDNRLLLAIVVAIACLALSASCLVAGIVAQAGVSAGAEARREIPGRSLQPVGVRRIVRGEGLLLGGFRPGAGGYHAAAIWRGALAAEDFSLLRYDIQSQHPGPALTLVWRRAAEPGLVHAHPLSTNDIGSSALHLAGLADWQGSIIEIGIYAVARQEDAEVFIAGLALQPADWRGLIDSYITAWTDFRGWSHSSINYLEGAAGPDGVSPVPLAAAWSGLGLLFLLLALRLAPGAARGVAFATVLLLPWILLDLLWQRELLAQLALTRAQFSGKSMHEKHLAADDRYIYRYIRRLKRDLLPAEPARILLVHQARGHNFDRLKAQYYLLPHNVYNFGLGPALRDMRKGDFVLVLGATQYPEYDPGGGRLVWEHGVHIAARVLDTRGAGRLYKITEHPPQQDRE